MLKLKSHVGSDGILKINMPIGTTNVDCDITITIQPSSKHDDWLQFIDETYGSLQDDEFERLPQGEFEH